MLDALVILPEEIWSVILSLVEDPVDLVSCSQTCILWNSLLSPSRENWMFQLVFPSLFNYLKYMKQDVLNCRIVSKRWSKGVDHYLESDQYEPNIIGILTGFIYAKFKPRMFIRRIPDSNRSPRLANQLMSQFKHNRDRNPFPSRTVIFSVFISENCNVPEFIKHFGCHIWSLGIRFSYDDFRHRPTLIQMLNLIWSLLECVPNLKNLHLWGFNFNEMQVESDDVVNEFLQSNAAPKLYQLRRMDLLGLSVQLDMVLVNSYNRSSTTIFDSRSQAWGNALDTCQKSLNYYQSIHSAVLDIHKIDYINVPLKSIRLSAIKSCIDLKKVLAHLLKFRTTLLNIELTFKGLKLEEIEKMNTEIDAFYNFVSKMECLRTFDLFFYENTTNVSRKELVKFVNGVEDTNWMEKYRNINMEIRGSVYCDCASIVGKLTKTQSSQLIFQKHDMHL